ncbi:MAG: dolichyl-phosphate beta-glucosyltransferase [Chthoniobacterales bacterium]
MNDPQLTIVIPAFNETRRLTDNLLTVLSYLRTYRPDSELIVVDDGSSDDTAQVAEELFKRRADVSSRVLRFPENRGKGAAVRAGLLAGRGQIGLFTDADLSTPITELPKIVAPIEAGEYDIAFGSRALDRRLIGQRQPWRREQGGKVFNTLVRLSTGLPFRDTQCGFKAFEMVAMRPVLGRARSDGFDFDVELLFLAHQAGLRMLEVPVRWDHSVGSKVHIVRDSLRMFTEVVNLRRRVASEQRGSVPADISR